MFCLALTVALSVLFAKKYKNATDKKIDKFLFITSIIVITFEIYKQVVFSFHFDGKKVIWDYQWYAFPFQFCSTPMYIMLIASIVKNEKIKNVLYSFLGTFALFAGTAVMLYPGDVFVVTLGINIQTMVCHGSMVIVGIVLLASKKCQSNSESIIKGFVVFLITVCIAIGLNFTYKGLGGTERFNMMFLSPYHDCGVPFLEIIQKNAPYPVFVLSYIFGFTLATIIVIIIALLVEKILIKLKNK